METGAGAAGRPGTSERRRPEVGPGADEGLLAAAATGNRRRRPERRTAEPGVEVADYG